MWKGFTVFAGFSDKQKGNKLKEESSARLHVLQLDVSSESDVQNVYQYVNKNLPSNAPGMNKIYEFFVLLPLQKKNFQVGTLLLFEFQYWYLSVCRLMGIGEQYDMGSPWRIRMAAHVRVQKIDRRKFNERHSIHSSFLTIDSKMPR